mmetsp:Transcript_1808/g.3260  ORF Transcript_1808/g.3260 Transcript_1808/m.3260 type:complete len:82 (+) Transcript_1808:1242-1487(+)
MLCPFHFHVSHPSSLKASLSRPLASSSVSSKGGEEGCWTEGDEPAPTAAAKLAILLDNKAAFDDADDDADDFDNDDDNDVI